MDAKVLARLHGLIFVHASGWTNIWLESDSEFAVKVLRSSSESIPWRIKSCWEKYAKIRPNINVFVTHIYREGNSIADKLAKLHTQQV